MRRMSEQIEVSAHEADDNPLLAQWSGPYKTRRGKYYPPRLRPS